VDGNGNSYREFVYTSAVVIVDDINNVDAMVKKLQDMEVNVCKKKQLTNTRSSGSDDALKLSPPKVMSLEQALDFIDTDELLEITPKSFRIRKKILDHTLRYRANRK
jgi:GTP-binding protein